MPKKNWIVTTTADRQIREIAGDLEKAGFTVGAVNDEIQSITGSAEEATVTKLRGIAGVADVSPDAPIDIGPPGSSDTW